MDRHQLDRRDPEREQVVDDRVVGHGPKGSADAFGDARMNDGEATNVALVDHRPVPGGLRRAILAPGERGVDHHALRHRPGAVPRVDQQVLLGVPDRVPVQGVAPSDGPADGLGVRVDQELVRVEPVALLRLVRSVDPVAVQLPGAGVGKVTMPDQVRPLPDGDPLRLDRIVVVIEQAQLDPSGVLGEQGEVHPLAVPGRPLRIWHSRPDPHHGRPLPCPLASDASAYGAPSDLTNRHPRGGSVRLRARGRPCTDTGTASSDPRLPQLLPPYRSESLFRTSRHVPPRGTPVR